MKKISLYILYIHFYLIDYTKMIEISITENHQTFHIFVFHVDQIRTNFFTYIMTRYESKLRRTKKQAKKKKKAPDVVRQMSYCPGLHAWPKFILPTISRMPKYGRKKKKIILNRNLTEHHSP